MIDPRMTKLADTLVTYSCKLCPGERVLIENTGIESDMVAELVRAAYRAGAQPFVWLRDPKVQRALLMGAPCEQLDHMAEHDGAFMKTMQAYIGLRSPDNACESADVPGAKQDEYARRYAKPVHSQIRVPQTKWVVLRYPTPSMAQSAGRSTEDFEQFYFDVCTMDYAAMSRAMDPLVALMQRTDKVRITAPGTDLTFSIKGIPAVKCDGQCNIPDGEVYTAPVRESVQGTLRYNTPTVHSGITHEGVTLRFERGKIVEASSSNTAELTRVLDTDEGSRYVGEFAIGVNPYIHHAMKDTLFDEKIAGSFHFTPGNCYDEAPNGNKSAIHWDMVLIQTPAYGGGEMYFDGVLVRRDGQFVLPELLGLNPDQLR